MEHKTLHHPMEEIFGIAPGSTASELLPSTNYAQVPAAEAAQPHKDDAEDIDITNKIETIYGAAMEAYENQVGLAEIVEPRYAARNAEVANQSLTIALNAVALKARTKNDKRKGAQFIPFGNVNSNNNVVVADRNQILAMIAEKNKNNES